MADVPEPSAAAAPADASAPAAVERRIVSVLFADLVGFTPLSERLDVEDVAAIQDAYFAATRETLERYGGTVEKFIGDAVMAVFGIPRARDDDAERAVRAGLSLIGAVEQLGARLGLEPGELQLRVGVNSGEVVHAVSGPDAGRVTGDTVNTAARLQTASVPNRVLVGEVTALAAGDAIELEEPIEVELKGKARPVRARLVTGIRAEPSRDAALGELRAPILGRHEELAFLEGISSGRVTIVAPPGVGKSRLVAELGRRAQASGHHVIRARIRPQAGGPYDPVAELLRAAGAEAGLGAALRDQPFARRTAIIHEVEVLLKPAVLESGAGAEVRDVASERDVRMLAWIEALEALIGSARSTWIVEDVHWAGGDLLEFLDRAIGQERVIVCTARPSLLESAADWVGAGQRLDLSTLPAADVSALVAAFVGDALPSSLVEAIAQRSDGNPLFVEELLRSWASVGTLERSAEGWRLAVEPEQVPLPATVQAIYAAQLDDLPADARLVARRASVAGRRFPDAALKPLQLDEQRGGLETLRRRAFVVGPHPDPVSGDVYAYRHALLRDAGYASLARAERAQLHVALARWLESTAGERSGSVAQLVAEHFAAAADAVPALPGTGLDRRELMSLAAGWFELAADAAVAMAAPDAAVRHLARSLELTEGGSTLDLARRRLRRGEVLADSAALDEAIEDMQQAFQALEPSVADAPELYAEAAYHLGLAYMQQIRFPEAETLVPQALERLSGADAPGGRARLMALHAWSVSAQGRNEGSGEEAQRAIDLAATVGDAGLDVDVLEHYAATADELGIGGIGVWEQLAERAEAAGRWKAAAIALRVRGMLTADRDPRAAVALHRGSAELAQSHGLTEQLGWADLGLCETLFVLGDWEGALEAGDRALDLGERFAYERLAFRTWVIVLPILAARGDGSWAARYQGWWTVAEPHFPPSASIYGTVLRAAIGYWLQRAAGNDLHERPPDFGEIPPFTNPHFLAAREILAEAYLAAGDTAAGALLAAQQPDDDATELMRASQALIGSWVEAAKGDDQAAGAQAAKAADHARSAHGAWWLARAHRAMGEDAEARDIEERLGIRPG